MDCSMPGLHVHHQLLEFIQIHVHWVGDAIQPSHPLASFNLAPASGSLQMSQFFTSGGQSIGVSASALVLPMNLQDWFPSGLTRLISLQSKGLSRVFSNTTVQKHQFGAFSQICTFEGRSGGKFLAWLRSLERLLKVSFEIPYFKF